MSEETPSIEVDTRSLVRATPRFLELYGPGMLLWRVQHIDFETPDVGVVEQGAPLPSKISYQPVVYCEKASGGQAYIYGIDHAPVPLAGGVRRSAHRVDIESLFFDCSTPRGQVIGKMVLQDELDARDEQDRFAFAMRVARRGLEEGLVPTDTNWILALTMRELFHD